MRYVDGFVVPVPKESLAAYRRLARKAGAIWKEYGASNASQTTSSPASARRFRKA